MAKHSWNHLKKPLVDDIRGPAEPSPHDLVISGDGRIGGSSAADQLTGGAGADILIGHGGADVLTGNNGDDVLMGERTVARNPLLAAVTDYAIIYNGLNGANYTQAGLKASDHDLIVLYPASQVVSHVETLWSGAQVADIGTSKLVIAYLDITKINDYETHVWQSNWTSNGLATGTNTGNAPSWLGGLDPGDTTSSTRLVNLDDPNWVTGLRTLLFVRIDQLVARGYDGLFLDDLRHFVPGNIPATADHARDIRDLVIDLAAHARAQVIANGGTAQQAANFAIIVNGAPYLIGDSSADMTPPNTAQNELYYASIDGILAESYFAGGDTLAINQTITAFGARGIALFAADPNVAAGNIAAIEAAADLAGFIPFAITGNNFGADSPRFVSTLGDNAPGGDQLFGGGGSDQLIGGGGNDLMDGGSGADRMSGGVGDDTYVVDSDLDQVLENAGQGNDIVYTVTSYVLSSNQEIETLSTQTHAGTENLFLTGNQLDNILIGNAGDNIMNGVGGADVMYGLAGNDTYAIDNLGDLVIDGFGQGSDLVLTYLSHTLSNGNEIETLSTVFHQGTDAINLGGNDYNNTLIGNYGANYLNGNGGVDVMIGLNGNDTYVAENAADVVQEIAGGGSDLLYSFVSYTLAAGQEVEAISTAVQGGTTAINLTGNEFAQTMIGNAGANLLDGKGGNDTLYGLGGTDTFAFTTAIGAGNVDTLVDFSVADDTIALDDAIFTVIGGTLDAGEFVIGSGAADANDRIIYNSATGALFYDADGNGGGAAVQFATLATGLALTAGDFTMI